MLPRTPPESPIDPSSSSHARLPTYEELQAERELKESFAQLSKDHAEIQALFRSVAAQLEGTPKIGAEHSLAYEWDALFKVRASSGSAERRLNERHRNTGSCTVILS